MTSKEAMFRRIGLDSWVALRARWPAALLACSLVLLLGAAGAGRLPVRYEADVDLAIPAGDGRGGATAAAEGLGRHATDVRAAAPRPAAEAPPGVELAADREWLTALAERSGFAAGLGVAPERGAALLRERVRLRRDGESGMFRLTVRSSDPREAVSLANAGAEMLVVRSAEELRRRGEERLDSLRRELAARERAVGELEDRLVALADAPDGGGEEVRELRRRWIAESRVLRVQEARLQAAEVEAGAPGGEGQVWRVVRSAALEEVEAVRGSWATLPGLLVIGVIAGVLLTGFSSAGRARWIRAKRLGEVLGVGAVGFVPVRGGGLLDGTGEEAALIEPYRDLRARIHRLPAGESMVLTLIPAEHDRAFGEAAANLGAVFADAGHTVLVIDADSRRPMLHEALDASCLPGLSDYLSGEMRLEETVVKTRRPNLWFLPSGPMHSDPSGLLEGKRMGDLLAEMRRRFDYILLASPPVRVAAEAGVLASCADHVVLAAPYLDSAESKLKRCAYFIESSGGRLAAVALWDPQPGAGVSRAGKAPPAAGARGGGGGAAAGVDHSGVALLRPAGSGASLRKAS